MFDRFVSWLYSRRIFGPRCDEYVEGCPCCEAWKLHDELFGDKQ